MEPSIKPSINQHTRCPHSLTSEERTASRINGGPNVSFIQRFTVALHSCSLLWPLQTYHSEHATLLELIKTNHKVSERRGGERRGAEARGVGGRVF